MHCVPVTLLQCTIVMQCVQRSTATLHFANIVYFNAVGLQFIKSLQLHSTLQALLTYNTITLYQRPVTCAKDHRYFTLYALHTFDARLSNATAPCSYTLVIFTSTLIQFFVLKSI